MKRVLISVFVLVLAVVVIVGGQYFSPWFKRTPEEIAASSSGPHTWATTMERPGLPNLHKVSDTLYRGARPDATGIRELKKMGVKTIINLEVFLSDRNALGDTGIGYESISFKTGHPEDEDVKKFLKIVMDPARQPVFVHCLQGSDRTGTMCAVYRIAVQGWSKEDAIDEMTQGDFGYHEIFYELLEYLRKADVRQIRRDAGLPDVPASAQATTRSGG